MLPKPIFLDLCCGAGTVSKHFIDVGYTAIGYDVLDCGYPGELILQDVRDVQAITSKWAGKVDVMWCSPPCTEFSRFRMPWLNKGSLPEPDLSIIEACYKLKGLINPRVFILENVRSAQKWLG